MRPGEIVIAKKASKSAMNSRRQLGSCRKEQVSADVLTLETSRISA